jgi:hypothetical protein
MLICSMYVYVCAQYLVPGTKYSTILTFKRTSRACAWVCPVNILGASEKSKNRSFEVHKTNQFWFDF